MKFMIASDIHGSALWCRKLLNRFREENAKRLLLLGDLLYHGPRNDLPAEYAPKEVTDLLNRTKDRLLCVRGNCDAEVDQMVLSFPVMADYAILGFGNTVIYATHGHIFGKDNLPPLCRGDVLLYGHTHVPECTERNGILIMNPGSVSIPKEDSYHGYMTFEDGVFRFKDLDGTIKKEYRL